MRFDKIIELIIHETIEDGLGGRTEVDKVIHRLNSNVEELSVEETFKIYGEATTHTIKAITLGKIVAKADKIRYDNQNYKIISKRFVKNKTSFLLELIDNE